METTTIAISLEIKKRLDKLKIHERQSYNEVLSILLKKR